MATEANGKLIIRSIPNEDVAQKVVTYMCANAKNTTPEAVAAKLKKLPLILSSTISAQVGSRVVQSLVEIGADAIFIPDQPTFTPLETEKTAPHPPAQTQSIPTPEVSQPAPSIAVSTNGLNASPLPNDPNTAPIDRPSTRCRMPSKIPENRTGTPKSSSNFPRQAAKASWAAPLISVVFLSFAQSALKNSDTGAGWLIIGGVAIALFVTGIVLGIIGICGSSKRGGNTVPSSVVGICLNVIFLCILIAGASKAFNVEKRLVSISKQVNKGLPKMIEEGLRLETTTVGPNKKFTYSYTLINFRSSDLDSERFKEELSPKIRKGACEDKAMKSLLKKGVTVSFLYSGNDSGFVAEIPVVAADCGMSK